MIRRGENPTRPYGINQTLCQPSHPAQAYTNRHILLVAVYACIPQRELHELETAPDPVFISKLCSNARCVGLLGSLQTAPRPTTNIRARISARPPRTYLPSAQVRRLAQHGVELVE